MKFEMFKERVEVSQEFGYEESRTVQVYNFGTPNDELRIVGFVLAVLQIIDY